MTYLEKLKAKLAEKEGSATALKTPQSRFEGFAGDRRGAFSNNIPDTFRLALPPNWNVNDWFAFEERAAILEFDGGLSRKEAEELALIAFGHETTAARLVTAPVDTAEGHTGIT